MIDLFQALTNTEFGDKVEAHGRQWIVIKDFPDKTALAVEVGIGFPAPVQIIQLEDSRDR